MNRRTASLRAHLILVIVLATVPLALLAGWLMHGQLHDARTVQQSHLAQLAASQAAAIRREIGTSLDALAILARLDAVERGDAAAFHRALTALPQLRPSWNSIYLVDARGDILTTSAEPYGTALGNVSAMPEFRRVVASRRPDVSGLRAGPVDGMPRTVIQVPVVVGDELRFVLGVWMSPDYWRRLLISEDLPNGDFALLADSAGRVIANSRESADGPSMLPSADPADPVDSGDGHGVDATSADGAPRKLPGLDEAYLAGQRIEPFGWQVLVGVPAEKIEREQGEALVALAAGGFASLAVGVALALLVARRVSDPLARLARRGPAAVRGRVPVREVAMLRDSLATLEVQREAARERLQASADELDALFATSPIGFAIARDANADVVQQSAALQAIFGAMAGSADADADAARDVLLHRGHALPRADWPLQRAASSGVATHGLELQLVQHDGRTLDLLAYAQPLRDAEGRLRGAVAGFVDITERVEAERRHAATELRLHARQQMVDLAQQAGQVGFFDYDFRDDSIDGTPGMSRLLGLRAEGFSGAWDDWMALLDGDEGERVTAMRRGAVEVHAAEWRFDTRLGNRGDRLRWHAVRAVIAYAADHTPLRMIGVLIDVSELKRAESERAEAMRLQHEARVEAERANRAKDEFLAMLGHELRNPLGAIAAAAEVLNRKPGEAVAGSARNIIVRQTRHMTRMMEDLLDVTRVIAGKVMLARQPVDLLGAIERLVSSLEIAQRLASHRLELRLERAWISADPTRIEQIAGNLLTNALKYTPADGRIVVSVRREPPWAVLEVADDGVGMTPGLVAVVFDLFVQGDRSVERRQGGVGVGLTLVKRLVELHGGSVSAKSDGPDRGSVLTVRLPLCDSPPGAGLEQVARPTPPKEVVIVEDNADALDAMRAMLELDGHQVRSAVDGPSGIALVLETRPQIAIVDIGLPGLDGHGVATELRDRGYAGRLVAISGYGQPADIDRALAAGFDAHLVKPIDARALHRVLADADAKS